MLSKGMKRNQWRVVKNCRKLPLKKNKTKQKKQWKNNKVDKVNKRADQNLFHHFTFFVCYSCGILQQTWYFKLCKTLQCNILFLNKYNSRTNLIIYLRIKTETASGGVLFKQMFLKVSQNSQENTCATCTWVSFLIKLQKFFIKKETLAQVSEVPKILKKSMHNNQQMNN